MRGSALGCAQEGHSSAASCKCPIPLTRDTSEGYLAENTEPEPEGAEGAEEEGT